MSSTVLVVDDSLTVRMDLSDAFEAAGLAAPLLSTGCYRGSRSSRSYGPVNGVCHRTVMEARW